MWGIIDNNGFIMIYGSLEEAVKADCEFRYIKVRRAFIVKFWHYAYRKIKKLDIK